MEKVYIIGIAAIAFVILVVALLYRGRLTRGRVSLSRDKLDAELEAQPGSVKDDARKVAPPLQPGKTVLDDDLIVKSRVKAPRDADFKLRRSKVLGSQIDIYEKESSEEEGDE